MKDSEDIDEALVLVVDDVAAIVEELVTLLDLQGIPACGAATLDDALVVLVRRPTVRVIACDVRLKGESGFDIISKVDRTPALAGRSLRYVFMTGDPGHVERLVVGTPHAVLTKPVRPRELVQLLRGLLEL